MADVSERRLRPIQEAVESRNWKQALQLCEKWHKKGEKSDRFKALRAYVFAKQQDTSSTKRGRDEIVQLCNRTPAITDPETIYQIQTALNDLGIDDDGGRRLWERAAAARPEDKEVAMTWLDEAIDRCDWQSAQKATMALRRSPPKDRNYEFWTVLMCYLLYQDQSVSEKERSMFGTLAYRLLAKAAEPVAQEKEGLLSPGNAIQSPEELSLLVRVYLNTGHVREAKDLLMDSKTLGPQSAIFKLDHDLHRSLQLELLRASEDWPAVLNELRSAVKEPSSENFQTSRMLDILFDAGQQKDNLNFSSELREILDDGLRIYPTSRDLNYGMIRFLQLHQGKDHCTVGELLVACKQYFSLRCEQLSCFDELRSPLEVLDPNSQQEFIEYARDHLKNNVDLGASSVVPLLNVLKLEYCFLITPNMTAQPAHDFGCKVVGVYQDLCITKRDSGEAGAQLAMLASMALLQGNQAVQEDIVDHNLQNASRLQAAFLLQYCLTRSRDCYPTLVVLTRLSIILGAVSISAAYFKKLSIKNLQWENAGHLLLTRLSTIHPHRSEDSEGTFDPLQLLDLAMAANSKSVRSVRKLIMVGLNNKSYVNVMETISLRQDLKRSFSKQMYSIESARTKRLREIIDSEKESVSSELFVDRRDFSFIPSFGHSSQKPFSYHLETGPRPKDGWLRVMKICGAILGLLEEAYHEPQTIAANNVQELASVIPNIPKLVKTFSEQLTDTEISSRTLQYHLGMVLTLHLQQQHGSPAPESHQADFDNTVQSIQEWLKATSEQLQEHPLNHSTVIYMAGTPIAPTWEYLHFSFSILECLQATALLLAGQAKASKTKSKSKVKNPFTLPGDQRMGIQKLVEQIEKRIHASSRMMKENLNASGVLGGMIDVVFGRSADNDDSTGTAAAAGGGDGQGEGKEGASLGKQLEKLPDAETVAEQFCGDIRQSWEDALDGVLSVRVKRYE